MKSILKIAEEEFIKQSELVPDFKSRLRIHIKEMLKWADYMVIKYPEANKEVIILGIYFHDILDSGFQRIDKEDHAILSERYANTILKDNQYPSDKIEKVLHCVRAHRNKDVVPNTIEAKIIATIDSASHITAGIYFDMVKMGTDPKDVIGKINRDYRDLYFFPEIQDEMKNICNSWKKLIKEYIKLNIDDIT